MHGMVVAVAMMMMIIIMLIAFSLVLLPCRMDGIGILAWRLHLHCNKTTFFLPCFLVHKYVVLEPESCNLY